MQIIDPLLLSIIQKSPTIDKAINEIRKIRAENQVIDIVNTKNGPLVNLIHNLLLNSNILLWWENNTRRTGKWTSLFKLLDIKDKTYKIYLSSNPTEFRNIIVKPYLIDDTNAENHSLFTVKILLLAQNLLLDTLLLPITKTTFISTTRPLQIQQSPIKY